MTACKNGSSILVATTVSSGGKLNSAGKDLEKAQWMDLYKATCSYNYTFYMYMHAYNHMCVLKEYSKILTAECVVLNTVYSYLYLY